MDITSKQLNATYTFKLVVACIENHDVTIYIAPMYFLDSALSFLVTLGVDEFAAITLKYSGERVAQLSCSIGVDLVNEAVVIGTKGKLKLPYPFWCPTKLETPEVSSDLLECFRLNGQRTNWPFCFLHITIMPF